MSRQSLFLRLENIVLSYGTTIHIRVLKFRYIIREISQISNKRRPQKYFLQGKHRPQNKYGFQKRLIHIQALGRPFIIIPNIQIQIKHQTMTQSLEINDEHLMNKLQEIVPELRKQLEATIRSRYEMNLQRMQEQKRRQLARKYELMIKQRVEESNNTIKNSLASMVQMIDNYKLSQKQKGKQMTRQQEEEFIEQTVQEILNDQNMVEEVKNRMRPKIEAKVKAALEKELEDGVQIAKKEFAQKLKEEREQWTQQRITFWKQESNRELEQLAQQHNEINNKKLAIQASYANKKSEKTQLKLKLNMIMEKNAMVSNLRRQLKQLKQKMRA